MTSIFEHKISSLAAHVSMKQMRNCEFLANTTEQEIGRTRTDPAYEGVSGTSLESYDSIPKDSDKHTITSVNEGHCAECRHCVDVEILMSNTVCGTKDMWSFP